MFKKAVKHEAKGRVALVGPSGSGKSYTMLQLARVLAGPEGKIAAIDTEHGSLSKYADLFDFDADEPSSFSADYWLEQLTRAEKDGYAVFCTDSLSHFWMGPGGALEFIDEATKVSGNRDSFTGWKKFRPHERAMVDSMLASPCHVICTMRTQTDYVEDTDEKGKKRRRKIGLKPVQREGLEYEFDLVGALDEDNTLIIDKSRVILADGKAPYTGKAFAKPSAKDFELFREWLKGAPMIAPGPTELDIAVADWTAFLDSDPTTKQLNDRLPQLGSLSRNVARVVWGIIKNRTEAAGLGWDPELKIFSAPVPQEQPATA